MNKSNIKFFQSFRENIWVNGYFLMLVLAFFLPRVVKKGLFGDGLLYASMARNMADGQGSIWAPFFSTSYWIADMPITYYENPPLMLWLESHFFTIFGDHWWVEKLFSTANFVTNALLLALIWIVIQSGREAKQYFMLLVFVWCLIPIVLWGNVNNLMDNAMLSCCLLAIYSLLRGVQAELFYHRLAWSLLGGCCIFLGILTKGPVALYPLPIALVYSVVFNFRSWSKQDLMNSIRKLAQPLVLTIWICLVVTALFGLLFWLQPMSLNYITQYFEQRLLAVIMGTRADQKLLGLERFYILYQLLLENAILIAVSLIIGLTARYKSNKSVAKETKRWIVFFIILGFGATLPILMSTKQSGIYLIPGIPMFAIAAALYWYEKRAVFAPMMTKLQKYALPANVLLIVFAIGLFGLTYRNTGTLRREKTLIQFLEKTNEIVPSQSKITVTSDLIYNFVYHTYFQRLGRYALHADTISNYFFDDKPLEELTQKMVNDNNYNLIYELENFSLYRKD